MNTEPSFANQSPKIERANDSFTTKKNMENSENKNSFEWVWYVVGLLAGILAVSAVTLHIGYLFLGGMIGLLLAGLFLNNIVKGREY